MGWSFLTVFCLVAVRNRAACLLLAAVSLGAPRLVGQTLPLSQAQATFSSSPVTISGRVINAVTGLPVSRALVRYVQQAMLTDHEGKFRFSVPTDASGRPLSGVSVYLDVTKPGFSMTNDPQDRRVQLLTLDQLAGPVELRLYPEAILTGTVTSPEGEALARINVVARRGAFDENAGAFRWNVAGQAQTNTHGDFRIPVPAGDYRIEMRYAPRTNGVPEAIMPVTLPVPSGSESVRQAIHILNGQEQHFDLRPVVRRTFPVAVSMESRSERGFPQITARTSTGISFNVPLAPNRGPDSGGPGRGQARTATLNLPTGTFTLSARMQDQEGTEVAETRVTVTGKETESTDSGVVLRFASAPAIRVELSIDPSATSDNTTTTAGSAGSGVSPGQASTPSPQQFGLTLQRVGTINEEDQAAVAMMSPRNGTASFNAPPGTYRLVGRSAGRWFIRSASYGSSELLGQTLVLSAGSASSTIRLVVTNVTGGLTGTVKLNGTPASTWVYLIPSAPSVTPVITLQSGSAGQVQSPYLPPGSYRAVAFERHHPADYSDPATLQRFSGYVQTVTITAGAQAQLNLNAVPQAESEPETGSRP